MKNMIGVFPKSNNDTVEDDGRRRTTTREGTRARSTPTPRDEDASPRFVG